MLAGHVDHHGTLKTKDCQSDNFAVTEGTVTKDCQSDHFVVTDGNVSCHGDNFRRHEWRRNCQIDHLLFSVRIDWQWFILIHYRLNKMADILHTTFSNGFSSRRIVTLLSKLLNLYYQGRICNKSLFVYVMVRCHAITPTNDNPIHKDMYMCYQATWNDFHHQLFQILKWISRH